MHAITGHENNLSRQRGEVLHSEVGSVLQDAEEGSRRRLAAEVGKSLWYILYFDDCQHRWFLVVFSCLLELISLDEGSLEISSGAGWRRYVGTLELPALHTRELGGSEDM